MMAEKKLRVGIDMRMAGDGFGIGRYINELVKTLISDKSDFEYVLFFDKNFGRPAYEYFQSLGETCRLVDIPYYSFKEQLKLPKILARERLDLVHFPHFNVPIFCPVPFVVTIHDLIHHRFPGKKKKNFLHRLAYKMVISLACRSASKIIAVSNTTKNDIINLLGANPEKICVVHEGVNLKFKKLTADQLASVRKKYALFQPFILAVGVWRRYKNLPMLAKAFSDFIESQNSTINLILVGEEDKFYPDIKKAIFSVKNAGSIRALGKISDSDLTAIYNLADLYISPSQSEGFGLTSLEAQSCGVPVLSSDIPVAREILGDSADFFNPGKVEYLTQKFRTLFTNEERRKVLSERGLTNAKKYSWTQTAELTKAIYKQAIQSKLQSGKSN